MLTWLALIVVVVGWTALSLGIVAALRAWAGAHQRAGDEQYIGNMAVQTGAVFAFVAAFILVNVWNELEHARDVTREEASALISAYGDARGLPSGDRRAVTAALRVYVHAVIDDEWSTMADGHESGKARRALERLQDIEARLAQGKRGASGYTGLSEEMTQISQYRALRLSAAGQSLVPIFWILLLGGGLLATVASAMQVVSDARMHFALTACIAVLTGTVLFLIAAVDRPFGGAVTVSVSDLQHVLASFREMDRL